MEIIERNIELRISINEAAILRKIIGRIDKQVYSDSQTGDKGRALIGRFYNLLSSSNDLNKGGE